MSCIRTVGLIPSAGLSSRMGGFKPLLPLGQSNIIRTAADSLLAVCEHVAVVTGREAESVEEQFAGDGRITCIRNPNYAASPMFSSICIGLEHLKELGERTFILPCDTPLIRKYTLASMIKYMSVTAAQAVKPVMNGRGGHPVAIDMHIADAILAYGGDGGLKGAIAGCCNIHGVPVADEGTLLDADTREDYDALRRYLQRRDIPTPQECAAALAMARTPERVREHCMATAKTAVEIAQNLNLHGLRLDTDTVYAAALLHDICRTEDDHAAAGAALLCDMGFSGIAGIVGQHMSISRPEELNECAVVYYADKIMSGGERITLSEKRRRTGERFSGDDEALRRADERLAAAETIEKNISRILD